MFRFLTKTLFVTAIWKRYKRTIITSVVLCVGYIVISAIHNDYVSYAVSADDKENLFLSYIIKWGALIVITAVYFTYNNRLFSVKVVKHEKNKVSTNEGGSAPKDTQSPTSDPFSSIREKSSLNSRGDAAINKKLL